METVHAAEQVSFQSSLIRVEVKAGLRFEAPRLKNNKKTSDRAGLEHFRHFNIVHHDGGQ